MIEYFTALVISYGLRDQSVEAVIWFENHRECQHVMQEDLAAPLYNYLMGLYGNGIMMRCEVSDEVSRELIRPKLRPEGLGNG
jgi:hypothetical protein